MPTSSNPLKEQAGLVIQRVVVPLWILAGALFKLYERDPSNLPVIIRENARRLLGLDLSGQMIFLRTLIGLEIFAALVIAFVPRLSKAMVIFMLSCFCAILVGEILKKAEHCGCFGSLPMKPWHMLVIDGSMLLGVIFLSRRRTIQPATSLVRPALAMIPLLAVGVSLSFAVPNVPDKPQQVARTEPPSGSQPAPDTQPVSHDPVASATRPASQPLKTNASQPNPNSTKPALAANMNPSPRAIPNAWAPPADVSKDWVGKPWKDIDLFQMMKKWPKDLNTGKHFVVFYSRTCEHCQLMFETDFFMMKDSQIAAVEIPFDRTTMRPDDALQFITPPKNVELLELPLGCKYTVTTPLAVRVEDGRITCAIEGGDYKACFDLN